MPVRVALIGAGMAGLCMSRHLANDPEAFEATCFDRLSVSGGLWNYSDETGVDKFGLPLPYAIHKNLLTNVPPVLMNFPDYDFPTDTSFVPFSSVKKYLDNYAEKFQVKKFVKFQFETLVTAVKPVETPEGTTWLLTSKNLRTDAVTTSIFDSVIVCTGHFQFPDTADIAGIDKFRGPVIHAKDYRGSDVCLDKNVLILGNAFSALEILLDIQGKARKIYMIPRTSMCSMLKTEGSKYVDNLAAIREVLSNGVLLENGECREIDVIFLAIGYQVQFPFLSPDCGIQVKNNRMTPLYNHVVCIMHPSLLFVGFAKRVPHCHVFDLQARYACALLKGDFQLPPHVEMLRREGEDYQKRVVSRGLPDKYSQDLFGKEDTFKYCQGITREANLKALPDDLFKVLTTVCEIFAKDLINMKSYEFRRVDEEWVAEKHN